MMNFDDLLGLTVGGVTLHNVLRAVGTIVAGKLTKVAGDVESGNVKALEHDAAGVVNFVEDHVPAAAKAVTEAKAKAEALVADARKSAADELRKLAEKVESATGADAPADAATAAPTA